MPYSVEGKLVVAISSRALLDFEDENRVFERDGEGAYIELQLARLDVPAREGVAFALVKKLLAFNTPQARHRVVLRQDHDLDALKANLFLSANENDVMSALESKVPAARAYPES